MAPGRGLVAAVEALRDGTQEEARLWRHTDEAAIDLAESGRLEEARRFHRVVQRPRRRAHLTACCVHIHPELEDQIYLNRRARNLCIRRKAVAKINDEKLQAQYAEADLVVASGL